MTDSTDPPPLALPSPQQPSPPTLQLSLKHFYTTTSPTYSMLAMLTDDVHTC